MTYLASKHSEFVASIPAAPVMPICHGPSDLEALAAHVDEVTHQFTEYLWALTREARSLNVDVKPETIVGAVRSALHDESLAAAIRSHAETMVELVKEWA
jgi:hypothetical protein